MCVVDYPAEILSPVRQRLVDIVHRLSQRRKALRCLLQPGGRSAEPGAAGRRRPGFFLRLRCQPCRRQCRHCRQRRAHTEQIPEGISGRLHAERTGNAAARIRRHRFDAPPRSQHSRCRRCAGKPRCCRGKRRVCRTQACPQHRTARKRCLHLPAAAQIQLHAGTQRHARPEPPQLHAAQCCCRCRPHKKRPGSGLFRREAAQAQPHGRGQQGIRGAVKHQFCTAAAAQCEAQRHPHQRAAACKHRRHRFAHPHPPGSHSSPQRTQQTDAAQRKLPEPMQQKPQCRSCCAGSKAVFAKAQHQSQPKRHQRPIQHSPAARKACGDSRQPAHRRVQLRPGL